MTNHALIEIYTSQETIKPYQNRSKNKRYFAFKPPRENPVNGLMKTSTGTDDERINVTY
jgi:hypothetical protein